MVDDEERTTPTGLARYGWEYYQSAIAADAALGQRQRYELVAPAPVMHLMAQAIELVLKAYLRHNGYTLEQLKDKGHNLIDLWNAAASNNGITEHVQLTEDERKALEQLSWLHSGHGFELRYISTGPKNYYPTYEPLHEMTKRLLDAVCPHVGYRKRWPRRGP